MPKLVSDSVLISHIPKQQLHCLVATLAVMAVSQQHPIWVLTHTSYGALLQSRTKYLTVHHLLPSVPLGLAKGH